MIQRPIFSTWARYSKNVSDEVVRKFAREIIANGYSDSQLELDDYWEVTVLEKSVISFQYYIVGL